MFSLGFLFGSGGMERELGELDECWVQQEVDNTLRVDWYHRKEESERRIC